MSRTIPPTLVVTEEDEDGTKYGVPMRRVFRDIRAAALLKRKPQPSEKGVMDAAQAKRDRRRRRNLDRA